MPETPDLIDDRYAVLHPLGEGSSGQVLLVSDRQRGGARVALKWLKREAAGSESDRAALIREFRLLARLSHPAVARVHDLGTWNEQLYFTLEHVDGPDLVEAVRLRGIDALPRLLVSLGRGLAYLHARGLAHGDLKPSNLLVSGDGVKIVDLGLARARTDHDGTDQGSVSGTPAYMAPERFRGEPADAASDLYALGAVLFEVIAGRPPFPSHDLASALEGHLNRSPEDLSTLTPTCPPALASLVAGLLSKRPEDRPASARAVVGTVVDALGLPTEALASDLGGWLRSAPLIGREAELDILREAVSGWLAPSGGAARVGVLLVAGPSGVGKSRLLDEATLQARLLGAQVREVLSQHGSDAAEALSPTAVKDLLARGRERPTLLALDDLQRGHPDHASLLAKLGRSLAALASEAPPRRPRLVVVAAFRQDEGCGQTLARLAGSTGVYVMPLAPLDAHQTSQLAAGMLGIDNLPESLRRYLRRESGGNPLFVEEALRSLAEQQLVGPGTVSKDLPRRLNTLATPEGVASLVRRRLDGLLPMARRAVDLLAIQPTSMGTRQLAQLDPDLAPSLDQVVDELIARQILECVPRGESQVLRFRQERLREVAASTLPPARRRALHRLCARRLEESGQEGELLARHLIEAGETSAARKRTLEAADALEAEGDYSLAVELLQSLRGMGGADVELAEKLGELARRAGMTAVAASALEEAVEAASGTRRLELLQRAIEALIASSRFEQARARIQEALAQDPDADSEARLKSLSAKLLLREGRYAEAAETAQTTLDRFSDQAPDETMGQLHATAANALLFTLDRTHLPQVTKHVECCRAIARRRGDAGSERDALRTLGHAQFEASDLEAATASYQEALELARSAGDVAGEGAMLNNLGMIHQGRNDLNAAAEAFERALDLGTDTGTPALAVRARTNLARVARARGQMAAAEDHFARAREEARAQGDSVIESACLEEWAHLCNSRDRPSQALAQLQEALTLRKDQGSPARIARSEKSIADLWSQRGDPQAAVDGYRRAANLFAELADENELASLGEALCLLASRGGRGRAPLRNALVAWRSEETFANVRALVEDALDRLAASPEYEPGSRPPGARSDRPGLLPLLRRLLDSDADLEPLLEVAMGLALEATGAERSFLILVEPDGGLRWAASRNLAYETVESPEFEVSHGIVKQAAKAGQTISVDEAHSDARFASRLSVRKLELRSIIAVPIKRSEQVLGVVYLDDRRAAGRFDSSSRELLESFCEALGAPLENALIASERREQLKRLEAAYQAAQRTLEARYPGETPIIGRSPQMQELFRLLDRVAPSRAPVVVVGESGTGKELVARAIHARSDRAKAPFVAESCGAIAPSLLESVLFGHERGSFTGATEMRRGLFELAHGGTLFLDEVAETSPAMQAQLLRALQEGEVRRIGAASPRRVDVRLVCASQKDLSELVASGRFREDLYYRLNVVVLRLPPLRERLEDMALLAGHFLDEIGAERNETPRRLSRGALGKLAHHPFPGNVRELRNALVRAVLAAPGRSIGPEHLELLAPQTGSGADPRWRGLHLNDRQRAGLTHLLVAGSITSGIYSEIVNTSSRTSLRDLQDLATKGVVVAEGQKKGRVYRLVDPDAAGRQSG